MIAITLEWTPEVVYMNIKYLVTILDFSENKIIILYLKDLMKNKSKVRNQEMPDI